VVQSGQQLACDPFLVAGTGSTGPSRLRFYTPQMSSTGQRGVLRISQEQLLNVRQYKWLSQQLNVPEPIRNIAASRQ
jgi:hypothetical protein